MLLTARDHTPIVAKLQTQDYVPHGTQHDSCLSWSYVEPSSRQ